MYRNDTEINYQLYEIFNEISLLIEICEIGDKHWKFKSNSFKRASESISNLEINLAEIYRSKNVQGLREIPSIGKTISSMIEEFIVTGKIKYYDELTRYTELDLQNILKINSIGVKTVKKLYQEFKIKNIKDIESLCESKKIQKINGFSSKKEDYILSQIKFYKQCQNRIPIGEIYPILKKIQNFLIGTKSCENIEIVGECRRMNETVKEISMIMVTKIDIKEIIKRFQSLGNNFRDIIEDKNTIIIVYDRHIEIKIHVVPKNEWSTYLLYETGNIEHILNLENIAKKRSLKLRKNGIFNQKDIKIPCYNEKDIYDKLSLNWIPPELRENTGEIQIFNKYKSSSLVNNLIGYNDLKGDLQVHTLESDGTKSIEEMALYAYTIGLEYIAITDHTKSLTISNGLNEEKILNQIYKINELNDKLKSELPSNFKILSSAEVNILKDGNLDIASNVLDKLDLSGAAIHSNFLLSSEDQTKRLIKAIEHPSIDIIFHPTGRLINKREGYKIDIEKIFEVAYNKHKILEIDANYNRLDLNDKWIRIGLKNGVKFAIDSDAHHPFNFEFLNLGIAQARRGWAEKSDIINTMAVNELLDFFKK